VSALAPTVSAIWDDVDVSAAATPTLPWMFARCVPLDALTCTKARLPLNCTLPPRPDVTLLMVKIMTPLTTSSFESRH